MSFAFVKVSDDREISEDEIKEIESICRPVVEYIQKKYDPHTKIVIGWSFVTVDSEELGIPFEVPD